MIKDNEDNVENGGQRQLMDSSLITSKSDENKLEHNYYHNVDLFPTLPNEAYGTAGKTLCPHRQCVTLIPAPKLL